MDKVSQFYETIQKSESITLATADEKSVSMRLVSPVLFQGGVLLFTDPQSRKYRQLQKNPHCCIAAGNFFAECKAEFLGPTMADRALRDVYCEKFPGAFDEDTAQGGRGAEFLLLRPLVLQGWGFENDIPTADGIPNMPFAIPMEKGGEAHDA